MPPSQLDRTLFLQRRRGGVLPDITDDVVDAVTGEALLHWRVNDRPWLVLLLSLVLPVTGSFDRSLQTVDGRTLARVRNGNGLWPGGISVFDGAGRRIGGLRTAALLSLREEVAVVDAAGATVCVSSRPGDGTDCALLAERVEIGHITRKYSSQGRAFVGMPIAADLRLIRIDPRVPVDSPTRLLILAAGLVMDGFFSRD